MKLIFTNIFSSMRNRFIVSILLFAMASFTITAVFANEFVFTKEELCRLIIERIEQQGTEIEAFCGETPFDDCDDPSVLKAYNIGLIKGNDKGKFYPMKEISNQDAAVVFKRLQDYVAPKLIYDTAKEKKMTGWENIRKYAASPIAFLTMVDVIQEGEFEPEAMLTEQIANDMIDRIYQNKETLLAAKPGVLPKKKVPVLMYHVIGNPTNERNTLGYLCVSPEKFDEQLKYLKENGYTFLFPDEIYYADHCEKPVIITFDDGYDNNYDWAYKIAKKYNAKITIYMVSSYIDTKGFLNSLQLKEMADSRLVTIGSHTVSHQDLSKMTKGELKKEFEQSKQRIEKATQRPITDVSYPFGNFSDISLQEATNHYLTGFAVLKGIMGNAYAYPRVVIPRNMDMAGFQRQLAAFR